MANRRQLAAAASGKKSRKPSAKENTHKPMDKAESTQPDRPTPDSGFSLLLDLPPELRIKIYEYAVWTDGECMVTKTGGVPEPPLLMTSKAIRKEAMDVYYSINTMRFMVLSFDHAAESLVFHKLQILEARYGVKADVFGAAFSGPPNWTNLKAWLHSLQGSTKRYVNFKAGANEKMEFKMVIGLMHSAVAMRALSWKEAESSLELLRAGLIAIDARWASN
jgi:hypothetical protein